MEKRAPRFKTRRAQTPLGDARLAQQIARDREHAQKHTGPVVVRHVDPATLRKP